MTTTAYTRRVRGERWENIPHRVLRDSRLSYRARGVLIYLLSLPDEWRTSAEQIAREGGHEGRDAVRRALAEIEDAGYLIRRRSQDAHGRWRTSWLYGDDPDELARQVAALDDALPDGSQLSTTLDTDDGFSVSGVTCGNAANSQVAPKTENQPSVNRTSVSQSSYEVQIRNTDPPPSPSPEPSSRRPVREEEDASPTTTKTRTADAGQRRVIHRGDYESTLDSQSRDGGTTSPPTLPIRETHPSSGSPTSTTPRQPVDPASREEEERPTTQRRPANGEPESPDVARVLDATAKAWQIGRRSRARLRPLVEQRLDEGHRASVLIDRLTTNQTGAKSALAVLLARLNDLPEPAGPALPPLCGECDNRLINIDDSTAAPCPRCHPKGIQAAESPSEPSSTAPEGSGRVDA